jgi:hypothetical protein
VWRWWCSTKHSIPSTHHTSPPLFILHSSLITDHSLVTCHSLPLTSDHSFSFLQSIDGSTNSYMECPSDSRPSVAARLALAALLARPRRSPLTAADASVPESPRLTPSFPLHKQYCTSVVNVPRVLRLAPSLATSRLFTDQSLTPDWTMLVLSTFRVER